MRRGLVMRRFRGDFLAHLGLLGRLLASFWLCWGALGRHFGSLGTLLGLILDLLGLSWGLLGSLFGLSWPKLAQDSEKNRFFECDARIWAPSWDPSWGPSWPKTLQNRGQNLKKAILKNNTVSTSILEGFRPRFGRVFGTFF